MRTWDKIAGRAHKVLEDKHKRLPSSETEKYRLEVMECGNCGFHMGIDASFLEQVGDTVFPCPSCGSRIDTAEVFPE